MSKLAIPEILAPCGSYDILIAAIKAGADACYIGGNKFGARAYAPNLDNNSYKQAIEYAHLHDTRIYLTVNTLFKNNEIDELYDFLLPYYEAGIDAVIVQDLGVFSAIRQCFPELKLHCSTQMNITSWQAAAYMKAQGADRIVTAREMNLSEIKEIKDKVDIEVESFVHGAMCYSYSGQCLMSSYAGGRSGNRGRCAQPCRQCYDGSYVLSMKDMCTLEHIPEIIDAGIDSLKIEGRMKNEYYVASAVDAYKQMATDYAEGRFDPDKALKLKFKLANIYNRGGFSCGYYMQHNGADMISLERPNNQGVYIGHIGEIVSGGIIIPLEEDIYKGDVLEIKLTDGDMVEITSPEHAVAGDTIRLNAPKTKHMVSNTPIYRTRCNHILDGVKKELIDHTDKKKITGYLTALVGERLSFTLNQDVNGEIVSAIVYGDMVEASKKSVPDKEVIMQKLSQVGDTDYVFDEIYVDVSENAFIPMGSLKKLRREAISMLEQALINRYRKNTRRVQRLSYENLNDFQPRIVNNNSIDLKVGVITLSQLSMLCDILDNADIKPDDKLRIQGVYLNISLYERLRQSTLYNRVKSHKLKLYIELPYVVKGNFDIDRLSAEEISGLYVRNIDGYAAVRKSALYDDIKCGKLELVIGYSLYALNNQAMDFIGDYVYENPQELSLKEAARLYQTNNCAREYVLYGYQQAMISAQCIQKTLTGCSKDTSDKVNYKRITDGKANSFYARTVCDECINIIYNGIPYSMLDRLDEVLDMAVWDTYRVNFTIEPPSLIQDILRAIVDYNTCGKINMPEMVYTMGHNYRGVE